MMEYPGAPGALPATTIPLPALSADTHGQLRALSAAELAAIDRGEAAHSPSAGARWAVWGAARSGARTTLTTVQKRVALGLTLAGGLLVLLAPHATFVGALALVTAMYLITSVYKVWLLARGERAQAGRIRVAPPLADADLPRYSVLVPLRAEGAILPALLARLQALDYPPELLDILLLIEADDGETRVALRACVLPAHIRPVTVPPGEPRTKPRALNAGLARARGEFVVVYDAEDQPEPGQLRKAAAAFRAAPGSVACFQARLAFYNPRQSLLTRLFTLDYSIWYDLMLGGVARGRSFTPLGGTSNHLRVATLRRLGGWDPYNVTEDADLGMRLARAGLSVRMLDSVTREEAVAAVRPWVRQRSRWVKGYMQTYLAHMRDPRALWRQLGPAGFFHAQALLGGSSLVLLLNPLMWLLTLTYLAGRGTVVDAAIQTLFPPAIYYPALLCLVAGNFVFFYTNVYACVRAGYDDLARAMLLCPLYWLLMSAAAWVALVDLIRQPFYWAKTAHGVSAVPSSGELQSAI